ncbi:hypothetical protein RZS08_47520, partial [Arthrospira platensis SPKY1]|nr:hypothetical protein [Arthrospira platensis SPKY1]
MARAAGFVAVAGLDRAIAGDPLQGGEGGGERSHGRPREARGAGPRPRAAAPAPGRWGGAGGRGRRCGGRSAVRRTAGLDFHE